MTERDGRDRWREVQALLDAALDLPGNERETFLRRACGDRPALLVEVTELLRACSASSGFLDEPVSRVAAPLLAEVMPAHEPDRLDTRVGPYRIVSEAGRGGMGAVFVAERADGEYEKRVAIKLVSPRCGLEQFGVRRFREERQILASLEHPGIARMLDGGVAEDGTPWFAMELVEGSRLDEHCATNSLGTTARLELFLQVCDAVQYAHARGIVHCDLKPANILVVGDGTVKLLDFGIATLATQAAEQPGPRLLTPRYASPEQRAGEPATAASDVYSLGVLLEELLAPSPPRGVHDVIRKAREQHPNRRYATAGALADDLRAWQDSHRPSSRAHSAKTFAILFVTTAAIALVAFAMRGRLAHDTSEALVVAPEPVVVLPFEPVAADSALSRIGIEISEALAFDLARLGDVRIVGEHALATRGPVAAGARRSLAEDVAFARAVGARTIVRGTMERAGAGVRSNATVLAAERRTPLAYVAAASPADARAASDSLIPRLLHQLSTMRADRPSGAPLVATRSVASLEAFLEGEHLIVDYRMPEAAAAFARAIRADSTFRVAAWRLDWAMSFIGRPVDSGVTTTWRTHLEALSEPDRLLARARVAPSLSDHIALARDATRRFPGYWPAWLDYGDALLHLGPYAGVPLAAARAPLERAVELNPRLLPAWDHLMMLNLSERDTARAASVLATLRRLRYDSTAASRGGVTMLDFYGYGNELLRSRTGAASERATSAFVRLLTLPNRGDEGRFQGGFLRYGFPRARIEAARRAVRQHDRPPARIAFEWNEVASAWMMIGAFDSAVAAIDRAARADTSASRALAGYRLATVAAWLGGVTPASSAARRPSLPKQARLRPPEKAELAWVDGLLAVARRDPAALDAARIRLRALPDDTVDTRRADSSLFAFAMEMRGDRAGAVRTMSALELDRFDDEGGRHPYRSGIDRLALGRWLRAAGRNAEATRVLRWTEAVIAREVPLATANAVLAGPARLERARAESAQTH